MTESQNTQVIIPHHELSVSALLGVIKQFISRDGIDSSHVDLSFDEKVNQVKKNLDNGNALLVFEPKTQSCNILSKTDPELRKIIKQFSGNGG